MEVKPDWSEIALGIGEDLPHKELNSAWSAKCNSWLESISAAYGGSYNLCHSENFSILSMESDRYTELFSSFLERTLRRILDTLSGIATDRGYGNHVVIVFSDIDQYYDYINKFCAPDDSALSSGMYINEGYGHFVFPTQEISISERIAIHELTHACLAHLPIPVWLNEGIAVLMEEVHAGFAPNVDRELVLRHQKFWNEETIQKFWSGESFHALDEGQELSYSLALIMLRKISRDYEEFKEFTNNAHFSDAGEETAFKYLGISLSQIVGSFLGEGDWRPKKELNDSCLPLYHIRQRPLVADVWFHPRLSIMGRT